MNRLLVIAVMGWVVNANAASFPVLTNWQVHDSPSGMTPRGVVWSPELSLWVVVADVASPPTDMFALTSPDGLTWTPHTTPDRLWWDVAWSPSLGIFAAIADIGTNQVMTSTNGADWVLQTTPGSNYLWQGIAWSPQLSLFAVVGQVSGTQGVMTSPNGTNWTQRTAAGTSRFWNNVCWSPQKNIFVAVGQDAMTSSDGINWTLRTTPSPSVWQGVCWSPQLSLFCAVAGFGTGNRVMTSPDGITWTSRTSAADNEWISVTWGAEFGLFVACAQTGANRIMTSPNGFNWTAMPAAWNSAWNKIAYSPDLLQFVAIADENTNKGTNQIQSSLHTLVPSPATYYIDYLDGLDSHNGLSTGGAWQRHPYMNGFSGTYAHAPGDRFIFRGGVTWPRTAFQLNIVSGGGVNARDYYGVDTNWFDGASWSRPVFDFENVALNSGGSSSAGVLVQNAPYITFDGIDIKRHRAPVVFGSSSVSFFGTTGNVTLTNCIIRDWSVAGTGTGSDAGGGVQNYSSGVGYLVTNCLLHQDNESNKCGYATKGINEVAYCEIRNTPNAIFAYTVGHHNHVHNIPNCTDPSSHANAMATSGPATTYANLIHDLGTGASAIFVSPDWSGGQSVDLVYNNVVYNVGLQAPIQLDTGGAHTATIGLRAYNNVLVANGGGYCIRVVERGTGPYGVLDVRNCQLIATGTPLGYNNPGIGNGNVTTVTLLNNITQTPAVATGAGYVAGNSYQPTSLTSPTVRAGTDLSTVFNVDRLGTIRPAGLWDIAAYQFTAGGITNPPPPTPLAPDTPTGISPSNGETDVTLQPILTASAFSDPLSASQIASQWIILQSGSVVQDSGIYIASTNYPTPTALANFTTYSWQTRYQNSFGLWSQYSTPLGFVTTNIVITNVPPPSTNPPPNPPPPSGVRLRVSNMNTGKVRAK